MENQFVDLSVSGITDFYNFNPDHKPVCGWTYLMKLIMMVKKYPETFDIINKIIKNSPGETDKKNGIGMTALMITCVNCNSYSDIECVKLLINSDVNVNEKNKYEMTSLMYASKYANTSSSIECVKLLISSGADVNEKDDEGKTSLMYASCHTNKSSSIECVKLLISSGANVNDKNNYEVTSLMYASFYINKPGSIECVKILISSGANVNDKNNYGMTSLMFLFSSENKFCEDDVDIIMTLIHKSKLTICDKNVFRFTAYDYYVKNNYDVLSYIQLEYLKGTKVLSTTKSAKKLNF